MAINTASARGSEGETGEVSADPKAAGVGKAVGLILTVGSSE